VYKRLQKKLAEFELDAFLVTEATNVNWLCHKGNYFLPANLLITSDKVWLATTSRNFPAFETMYPEYRLIRGSLETLLGIAKELKLRKIGFESHRMAWQQAQKIMKGFPEQVWVRCTDFIEDLRLVKTIDEIELIAEATAMADRAYLEFLNHLKIGMTEKEAKALFVNLLYQQGADHLSFDLLLASGKRCFLPHSQPTDKIIQHGDFVLMDFGIIYNGYCSDTTRTVVMGEATERQEYVYNKVLQSQIHALEHIKAGMTAHDCDALARELLIKDADLKPYCFDYGLGHGLGMTVHEKPRFKPNSNYIMKTSTVMSVEPGIYIPDWGGIRIEDLLVVGPEAPGRNLTHAPKELIVL